MGPIELIMSKVDALQVQFERGGITESAYRSEMDQLLVALRTETANVAKKLGIDVGNADFIEI